MYFENIPLDENRETSSSSGHKTQQQYSKAVNDQPLTEEMVTVKEQAGKYTGEENDSGNLERKQNGNNSQSKGKSLSGGPMKPVPFVRGNVFFIKSKEDVTEEENNDAANENTADNTKENDVEAFGHNTGKIVLKDIHNIINKEECSWWCVSFNNGNDTYHQLAAFFLDFLSVALRAILSTSWYIDYSFPSHWSAVSLG